MRQMIPAQRSPLACRQLHLSLFFLATLFGFSVLCFDQSWASGAREKATRTSIAEQLIESMPQKLRQLQSAQLLIEYWRDFSGNSRIDRVYVQTIDEEYAEVFLLRCPANGVPGLDVALAFVLVDGKTVDWHCCITNNRATSQRLLLEDIDGDGFEDVSFRAYEGWSGNIKDARVQLLQGKVGHWLYAFAIYSDRIVSLFPISDRKGIKTHATVDTGNSPISIRVEGMPEQIQEYEMFECRVSITNRSQMKLALRGGDWCALQAGDGECIMHSRAIHRDLELQPGETISELVAVLVGHCAEQRAFRWKYVPYHLARPVNN